MFQTTRGEDEEACVKGFVNQTGKTEIAESLPGQGRDSIGLVEEWRGGSGRWLKEPWPERSVISGRFELPIWEKEQGRWPVIREKGNNSGSVSLGQKLWFSAENRSFVPFPRM